MQEITTTSHSYKYYKTIAEIKTTSNRSYRFEVGLFRAHSHEQAMDRAFKSHFIPMMLPVLDGALYATNEEITSVVIHTYA